MVENAHPVRVYRRAQVPPVTLLDLATRIGITKSSLSRIETGKHELTTDLAQKISAETGIPMRVLCPDLAKVFADEAAE